MCVFCDLGSYAEVELAEKSVQLIAAAKIEEHKEVFLGYVAAVRELNEFTEQPASDAPEVMRYIDACRRVNEVVKKDLGRILIKALGLSTPPRDDWGDTIGEC